MVFLEKEKFVVKTRFRYHWIYFLGNSDHYVYYGVGGQRLDVDVKWQGATLSHMLRVHGKDAHKLGQVVLHVACVVAHRGTNPIQIHYASLLLQVHVVSS